jgi:hypothetical protein
MWKISKSPVNNPHDPGQDTHTRNAGDLTISADDGREVKFWRLNVCCLDCQVGVIFFQDRRQVYLQNESLYSSVLIANTHDFKAF